MCLSAIHTVLLPINIVALVVVVYIAIVLLPVDIAVLVVLVYVLSATVLVLRNTTDFVTW